MRLWLAILATAAAAALLVNRWPHTVVAGNVVTFVGGRVTYRGGGCVDRAAESIRAQRRGTPFRLPLCDPEGVAYDSRDRALYVASGWDEQILRVSPSGVVTRIAGSYYDPIRPHNKLQCLRNDGTSATARFCRPTDVAIDPEDGNLFVTDSANGAIRRVTLDGHVSTVAGGRSGGYVKNCRPRSGVGKRAFLCAPNSLAIDPVDGSVFVTDASTAVIMRLTRAGVIRVIAGTPAGLGHDSGDCVARDGTGYAAKLCLPTGISYDSADRLMYFGDGNLIRSIDAIGNVATIAGWNYPPSRADESAGAGRGCRDIDAWHPFSTFCYAAAIAYDPVDSSLYIADGFNEQIRRIDARGLVSSVAGRYYSFGTSDGVYCRGIDGVGESAKLCVPDALSIDARSGTLYIGEWSSGDIRRISLERSNQ